MRRPFEKLVEMVDDIEDRETSLGTLSEQWNEPIARIMDALDASRMLRGEKTYISMDVYWCSICNSDTHDSIGHGP